MLLRSIAMFVAYIFIFIGVIFLLNNTGLVLMRWDIIWPVILIAIGLYLIERINRIHLSISHFLAKLRG
ncbi:MAG: DUF5668 domain-containing protein [Patescibacteria group bacterium]